MFESLLGKALASLERAIYEEQPCDNCDKVTHWTNDFVEVGDSGEGYPILICDECGITDLLGWNGEIK
jgi:hypothetical protein